MFYSGYIDSKQAAKLINIHENYICESSMQWLNLSKGAYYDTGYYALYNGIHIIRSLLNLNLNGIGLTNPNIELKDEYIDQIKILFSAHYPYGLWRQKVIEFRKVQDQADMGSWLTSAELNLLAEHVVMHDPEFSFLKNSNTSILIINYEDLEATLKQSFLNNTIILFNDCGYWMTFVYYNLESTVENKSENQQKSLWFGVSSVI